MSGVWPGCWEKNETNPKGPGADPDTSDRAHSGHLDPCKIAKVDHMANVVG